MAARRSGPFSRRRGDRNRGGTRNNEEGKSRGGWTTTDSKDSRVFFRKRIPPSAKSSRENKRDATRQYAESGIKGTKKVGGEREKAHQTRISITESGVSAASNRPKERKNETKRGWGGNVTRSTDRISFLSGCEQILLPSNRAFPSLRGVVESLIFRPFPKKGDDATPVIQGFAGGRICAAVTTRAVRQNCRNDYGFLRETTEFIQGFEFDENHGHPLFGHCTANASDSILNSNVENSFHNSVYLKLKLSRGFLRLRLDLNIYKSSIYPWVVRK